jgi:hypothetical protein
MTRLNRVFSRGLTELGLLDLPSRGKLDKALVRRSRAERSA